MNTLSLHGAQLTVDLGMIEMNICGMSVRAPATIVMLLPEGSIIIGSAERLKETVSMPAIVDPTPVSESRHASDDEVPAPVVRRGRRKVRELPTKDQAAEAFARSGTISGVARDLGVQFATASRLLAKAGI